jgi:hypothetical protein
VKTPHASALVVLGDPCVTTRHELSSGSEIRAQAWSKSYDSVMSIDWGDVPTWFAAVVASGAAAAALRQLALQGRQLALQGTQIAEQQKVMEAETQRNRKRDELLDRQLRDFDQRARTWERQQAEKIAIQVGRSTTPPRGIELDEEDRVHAVTVINHSARPIRDVNASIDFGDGQLHPHSELRWYSQTTEPPTGEHGITHTTGYDRADLMKVGDRVEIVFPWSISAKPLGKLIVRFTDDADLRWQIDHNLRLRRTEDQSG